MKKILAIALMLIFCISAQAFAAKATAVLQPTSEGSDISGTATFEETTEGLKIVVEVENVTPGKHGFHIHEFGFCENNGEAAGGHFNPNQAPHGYLPMNGFKSAHAGDFGNIEVNATGYGKSELVIPDLTLTGEKHNVKGKSIILHEKEDDFGQPTGNAGGRIACGIIERKTD